MSRQRVGLPSSVAIRSSNQPDAFGVVPSVEHPHGELVAAHDVSAVKRSPMPSLGWSAEAGARMSLGDRGESRLAWSHDPDCRTAVGSQPLLDVPSATMRGQQSRPA